jgi:hypothetical protein
MVFLIALVPAMVVLAVGFLTRRKGPTLMAAILMAILGAITGSPVYMALDLVCVLVGYLVATSFFKKPQT